MDDTRSLPTSSQPISGHNLPSAEDLDLVAEETALAAATSHHDGEADGFNDAGVRCGACGTFRHASPRHKANCRYAGQNCPGCAYGCGDTHIASCPIASQFKLPGDVCCEGVDLPSIGNVHSPSCLQKRPVLRASHTLPQAESHAVSAAPLPPPTEAVEFVGPAGLFGRLLFAARDLGRSRVHDYGFAKIYCLECTKTDEHLPTCKTGRVLALVDRICSVAPLFQSPAAVTSPADRIEDDLPADCGVVKSGGDVYMQVDAASGKLLGFVERIGTEGGAA